MVKRTSKAETQGILLLVVIGLPIYWVSQVGEFVGWLPLILLVLAVIGGIFWYQYAQKKQRREALMAKYQDEQLVSDLMNESFWQGQTAEQLMDSLGRPHDIDQKLLKTKKKEVWKYNHRGGNRYGIRITLDNDLVVGWDQKTS
ncbi:DUF2845 domain-containing protein [Vibrio sp. ZF 223]|uniref:DUF2845 domain-containing protein n=1 Tax=Vibrio sp. ZF 223 TaxID=2056191 RepID=UPI000D35FA29|nr:DUF2845 domain-containing protein [Vibrio sp. ZF 223]PTQ04150.1 DUF2845 domain-containing protein [Vibrio sp. ZF 223]